MTSDEFFRLACEWAFERHTTLVADSSFLPPLKAHGIADGSISLFKRNLAGRGLLREEQTISGPCDFTIDPKAFLRYVKGRVSMKTMAEAQRKYREWIARPTGQFTSSGLASQLGVSEFLASCILSILQQRI